MNSTNKSDYFKTSDKLKMLRDNTVDDIVMQTKITRNMNSVQRLLRLLCSIRIKCV